MLLPHQEGFPYRARVLVWTTALCLVTSLVWPTQSLADHILAPLYGVIASLVTYGLFRLFLTGLVEFGEDHFPRMVLAYILIGFYAGILGTGLGLIASPFELHAMQASQMAASYYIATLPAGLFMAAAALTVLKKYYVAE